MLKAEDLALWMGGFVPDPTKESLVKTKEFDNSYDIEYTYEDQDGDAPFTSIIRFPYNPLRPTR